MSIQEMRNTANLINKSDEGYNMLKRWTLTDEKFSKIIPHKECDCSSACGLIAKLGGYPVDLSGTFFTGNFAEKLKKAGFKVYKFTKLSDLKAGDFVVAPGWHVEFVYDKDKFFSAHIDERGKGTGGKPGNQTGKEVGFRPAYNHNPQWSFIVRPPADPKPAPVKKPEPTKPVAPTKPAVPTTTKYYPKSSYKGVSLVDALVVLRINATPANRQKIAAANGISNYGAKGGTSAQNKKLLDLLKAGKLKQA